MLLCFLWFVPLGVSRNFRKRLREEENKIQKTPIEWVVNPNGTQGYSWNPITGCLNNCEYCYARKITIGFPMFKDNFDPTFHPERLNAPLKLRKPSTIFAGSMSDMFGDWVEAEWIENILDIARKCPQHRFLFLTKNPKRYARLRFPFPGNCFKGKTVTNSTVKDFSFVFTETDFVSAEPLLGELYLPEDNLKWLIIGSLNKNNKPVLPENGGTKKEWVLNLLEQADSYKIPVFMKGSLYKLYPDLPQRREIPYL